MEVKGLFSKDQTIGKINEVQLGLISTLTSEVISLVSPVDTKHFWKVVWYRTASVRMRTEWYDIVSFRFLGHFSVSPSFWTCFGMDCLIFSYPCECNPSLYYFLERTKVERYNIVPCEQGLGHGHMTILINTEINTEEEAQESVLNLSN